MQLLPKHWHLTAASFTLFFSIWSTLTYGGFIESFFLPSPTEVLKATITLFTEYDLLSDILTSVYRVMAGFLLAAIVGVPLGILIGTHAGIKAFFEPLIGVARYLPIAAFIPLCILWFGIGDLEKILFLFMSMFPYITITSADIASNVQRELIETARTLGFDNRNIITRVILPASMPGILDTLRVCVAIGWGYLIVAELVAANSGLGHVIIQSQRFLQTPNIIATLLIISILGILIDYLFKFSHRRLLPWAKIGLGY